MIALVLVHNAARYSLRRSISPARATGLSATLRFRCFRRACLLAIALSVAAAWRQVVMPRCSVSQHAAIHIRAAIAVRRHWQGCRSSLMRCALPYASPGLRFRNEHADGRFHYFGIAAE